MFEQHLAYTIKYYMAVINAQVGGFNLGNVVLE